VKANNRRKNKRKHMEGKMNKMKNKYEIE